MIYLEESLMVVHENTYDKIGMELKTVLHKSKLVCKLYFHKLYSFIHSFKLFDRKTEIFIHLLAYSTNVPQLLGWGWGKNPRVRNSIHFSYIGGKVSTQSAPTASLTCFSRKLEWEVELAFKSRYSKRNTNILSGGPIAAPKAGPSMNLFLKVIYSFERQS